MRETRLILIDGLPGSGKTTTALGLTDRLLEQHIAAQCILESAPIEHDHHLNVGGALHPAGSTTGARLFAQYSITSYIEESLYRWGAFVRAAAQTETVFVVESYPYQNAVRILLQFDASMDRVREYSTAIEHLLLPVHPVLIYFEHSVASSTLQTIADQRGPQWTTYAVELITDCPYARQRGLHGMRGALAFMQSYKAVLDDLVGTTQMPTLILEDCTGRWDACHREILAFLEV